MKNSKKQLLKDIETIHAKCLMSGRIYQFSVKDIFALGYLCGRYGLRKLINNEINITNACEEYDKDDVLGLCDTIKEPLIDLNIIKN